MTGLSQRVPGFLRDQTGSMTGGGLIFVIIFLMVGGLAVDVSNVFNQRTQMQLTADATAHAALYARNLELNTTKDDAAASAVALAKKNMPESVYGNVLNANDIEFGVWNAATRTFTADPNSLKAVRATAHRNELGGNEIATYLLKFAGFTSWDVATEAVFETYEPPCLREGFVAENVVDIQSNNSYFKGFCLHSNDVVSLNSNNFFEAGTIVSMPDFTNLSLPQSGYKTNIGLAESLRYGAMEIRLINALSEVSPTWSAGKEDMWEFLQLATRDGQLDYLNKAKRTLNVVNGKPSASTSDSNIIEATKDLLDRNGSSGLRQDAVNYVYCSSTSTQISIKSVLSRMVIITNCQIQFGTGGAIEDATIATLHTGLDSIGGSADSRIGKVDNCAAGGGAQLVSLGGMNFASGVSIHGGQLIALKEIQFAANGEGLKGTSIISGDTVSGTSNMEMGLCGTGMEDNLTLPYFRMVK